MPTCFMQQNAREPAYYYDYAKNLRALDGAALNAAAALYVAGVATDIADGLARARAAIDSGAARQAQSDFVRTTRELAAA